MLAEREGERLALLAWVRAGTPKEAYDADKFVLPTTLADQAMSEDFLLKAEDGKRCAKIKSIIDKRCVRCHTEGPSDPGQFPLEEFGQVKAYGEVPVATVPPGVGEDRYQKVLAEREGERLALIDWVKTGADLKAYEHNRYLLMGPLAQQPVTPAFMETDADGKRYARLQSILQARCVRCHSGEAGGPGGQFPLDSYESVQAYCGSEPGKAMPLTKLAETTHVHLLSFSMLFLLTGTVFSFTSYPMLCRAVLAPLALVAQVADIGCWWLSRTDPIFAQLILVTGGVVAVALVIHIVGSLWNMFDRVGKTVVLALLIGGVAGIGGLYVKVIQPHLQQEKVVHVKAATLLQ
jgi:mono/diheme cytochrome c family protein